MFVNREKFQMVKKQICIKEHRPVRELERAMDVKLFLDLQTSWPEDSHHHLVVLYMRCSGMLPMKGRRRQSRTIHQGHQPHMPQLNLEVGVPAIQLVGPQTTKEELMEIYLEVYKLHRQPSSPPSKPAIWEEIMAKVPGQPM